MEVPTTCILLFGHQEPSKVAKSLNSYLYKLNQILVGLNRWEIARKKKKIAKEITKWALITILYHVVRIGVILRKNGRKVVDAATA